MTGDHQAMPDADERNALIVRHLPLAKRLARRYAHRADLLDELDQVAALGLVKAARRFDASRGTSFGAYAAPTIVGEIKRYFRDSSWAVHVPRPLKEKAHRVEVADRSLTGKLGRVPTAEEIGAVVGLSADEVVEARIAGASFMAESLDAPLTDDAKAESRGGRFGSVDGGYEAVEDRVALVPALAQLSERDRLTVRLRFYGDMTQTEIGQRIGVSQMQVSRILTRVVDGLRVAIEH